MPIGMQGGLRLTVSAHRVVDVYLVDRIIGMMFPKILKCHTTHLIGPYSEMSPMAEGRGVNIVGDGRRLCGVSIRSGCCVYDQRSVDISGCS